MLESVLGFTHTAKQQLVSETVSM